MASIKKILFWILSGMSWDQYRQLAREIEGKDGVIARYQRALRDGDVTDDLRSLPLKYNKLTAYYGKRLRDNN